MNEKYKPPDVGSADRVYAIARAGLGSIPLVGAAAAELLQQLLLPPIEQRRTDWMATVGEGLLRLEAERGIRIEDLGQNPAFVDAVLTATQVAIRTSQENKRKALRNAVLNSALSASPDVTRQQVFLSLIDRLRDLPGILKVRMSNSLLRGLTWRSVASAKSAGFTEFAHIECRLPDSTASC